VIDIANEATRASQDTSAARSTLAALTWPPSSPPTLAGTRCTLTRNNQLDIITGGGIRREQQARAACDSAINFGSIVTANATGLASNTTNLVGALKTAGYTRTFPDLHEARRRLPCRSLRRSAVAEDRRFVDAAGEDGLPVFETDAPDRNGGAARTSKRTAATTTKRSPA
jgi:hypothetical protein